MAGRQDHGELGGGGEGLGPDLEQRGSSPFESGARYDEAQSGSERFQLAGGVGFGGGADVELEISGDRDTGGLATDGFDAFRVGLTLGEDAGDLAQQRTEEGPNEFIARPGAVGDASIYDGDWNSAAEAAVEEIGPEFGLCEDEQARVEGVEPGADSPGKIKRAIEDALGAEALAGQGLAGSGGGGDDQLVVRKGAIQLANQAAGRKHFAHRNSMKPDDGTLGLALERACAPEAFCEPFAILLRGGHLP